MWSVYGRYAVGMWLVCGWYAVGMWLVCCRYVLDILCRFVVVVAMSSIFYVGLWLLSVCARYAVGL